MMEAFSRNTLDCLLGEKDKEMQPLAYMSNEHIALMCVSARCNEKETSDKQE